MSAHVCEVGTVIGFTQPDNLYRVIEAPRPGIITIESLRTPALRFMVGSDSTRIHEIGSMTGDQLIGVVETVMRGRGIDVRDDAAFDAIQDEILDGVAL